MNHHWIGLFPSFIRTKLEGRFTLQKILSNSGWLIADRVLRTSVGLFVGIWVARYMGPERFGLYNYAIAFVTLFSPLAALGLDNIAIRNIVSNPDSADEILGSAFVLKFLGGVSAIILSTVAILYLRPNDAQVHWMVFIITLAYIFWSFSVIDFWFKSQIQSKYSVLATAVAFLLTNLGKVVLILFKAPLIAFAIIYTTEILLSALGWVVVYQIRGRKFCKFVATFHQAKELLRDCWPLILSAFMIKTYTRIDQIMLGNMVGDNALGIYSVAVRIAELWYFIPLAIASSVFPPIIESKKNSKNFYLSRLQKVYNIMTWIALPIVVFVSLLGSSFIDLFYGIPYSDAGVVLNIYIWAVIFVFWGVASGQFLVIENYTRIFFLRTFIGATANVALNLLFIPKYGVVGAAITTLVSQFLAVFCIAFFKNTRYQAVMLIKSLFSIPVFNDTL